MVKKILSTALAVLTLLVTVSGSTPSAIADKEAKHEAKTNEEERVLPTYPNESVNSADLVNYTIVYPAGYSEHRMKDVYLLQDTIEKVFGTKPNAVPDTAEKNEKEIILVSGSRDSGVSDTLEMLNHGIDYVIGVRNGNIVLGGNNHYADMNAIYAFINNYLGYDDVYGTYSEPKSEITNMFVYEYEVPDFTMMCGNFYGSPYTEKFAVKDVHDAHFNLFMMGPQTSRHTKESMLDLLDWCVRFELRVMFNIGVEYGEDPATADKKGNISSDLAMINPETEKAEAYDIIELCGDNPMIWGHYLADEPTESRWEALAIAARNYKAKYEQYGWKLFLNFTGAPVQLEEYTEFDKIDIISHDNYFEMGYREKNPDFDKPGLLDGVHYGNDKLHCWEVFGDTARRTDKEFWSYVMAYYLDRFNTEKMLPWSSYIQLCFGVDGIAYFSYEGWVVDGGFNKINEYWTYSQTANKGSVFVGEKLVDEYNYLGTYNINVKPSDRWAYLESPYRGFGDVITDVVTPDKNTPYLVGCYDKKDGDGNAFMIVNIETLDWNSYAETAPEYVKLKINGDDVHFYLDGEEQVVEKDADGYYNVNLANGYGWFVTVD